MNKLLKYSAVALIASTILTGCTQRITDFTVISTKNVDLSKMSTMKRGSERVQGEDALYFLAVIPLGTKIDLKNAIDNAIQKVPGAVALVDGVVSHEGWHVGIMGKSAYIVEGTPLIDPSLTASLPSNYMISAYNEKINDFEVKYVSKTEFEQFKAQYTKDNIKKSI